MNARTEWPHQTATNLHELGEVIAIDVFPEPDGFVALYQSDGSKRCPARTVAPQQPHRDDVLNAWACRAPLVFHP